METPSFTIKAILPSKRRDKSPTSGGDIPEDALDSLLLAEAFALIVYFIWIERLIFENIGNLKFHFQVKDIILNKTTMYVLYNQ